MNTPAIFNFGVPFSASAKVDRQAGIIRGVAVITGGITARGHDLEVDDRTVEQVVECGREKGKVQVKLDHKSGVKAICGYLANFRQEGNKGLADWFLLKTHEDFDKIIEAAERMPECFGLSASFAGPKHGEKLAGGKKAARCAELLAVDCVTFPAACPDGLFEAKIPGAVDMGPDGYMADKPTPPEPTNAQILEALNGLKQEFTERLDGIEARQHEIEDRLASDEPLSAEELRELSGMTDAELAENGLTREQVDAALAAVNAEAAPGDSAADAAAAGVGSPGDAPAQAATATALSALRNQVTELSRIVRGNSEEDQIETAFGVLESKIDGLTTELQAKDQQISALQRALKLSGGKAASPSAESARMFSRGEGDEVTEFEELVADKVTELAAKEPKKGNGALRAEAVRLCIKENPGAYGDYRKRKGAVQLAGED